MIPAQAVYPPLEHFILTEESDKNISGGVALEERHKFDNPRIAGLNGEKAKTSPLLGRSSPTKRSFRAVA